MFNRSVYQDKAAEKAIIRSSIKELESIMSKLDHIEIHGTYTIGGVLETGRKVLAEQAYTKAQFEAVLLMLYPVYKHLEVNPNDIKKYFRDYDTFCRFKNHYNVRNIIY